MSAQSSGPTARASTSSPASASSSLNPIEPSSVDGDHVNASEKGQAEPVNALDNDADDVRDAGYQHSYRRHKPKNSGGFLLQSTSPTTTQPDSAVNQDLEISEKVRGKRRAEDGDLIIPKRSSARRSHLQRSPLGSSPLATEVQNTHGTEQSTGPNGTGAGNQHTVSPNARHSLGSSVGSSTTSARSGFSDRRIAPQKRLSVLGNDMETAQIVNLALNLSESRRRNFSGSLPPQHDPMGGNRVASLGNPDTGMTTSAVGGSLRQHLQQQRQISRNISPRSRESTNNRVASPRLSQRAQASSRLSSALPDFRAGAESDVVLDASDATLARAEKARTALELRYEYRRLLQHVPKISSRSGNMSTTVGNDPAEDLGREYNPLQYVRNRRVRLQQKRPLDSESQGWKDVGQVRDWINTVANEREDGLSRIDKRYPLPPFDLMQRGLGIVDGLPDTAPTHVPGSQEKKIGRPRLIWEFSPWDLLADAYWLQQDDNKLSIEDRNGKKFVHKALPSRADRPRTSKEFPRDPVRRSESIKRAEESPLKFRASFDSFRSHSKERGRRLRHLRERASPTSDDDEARDWKGRWPRRFVRSRSPSSSSEYHKDRRHGQPRVRDFLGTRDDYDNAALEKHMKEVLAKEAEESGTATKDPNETARDGLSSNPKPLNGGVPDGVVPKTTQRRPSVPQRMRTDMPTTTKTKLSPRASLDEQRFNHHRMSSDDFNSTAPNSPTASGFIPSIAINLSPPASPSISATSPAKVMPARLGSGGRNRRLSANNQAPSEYELGGESGTSADVSRQTTTDSQMLWMSRKEGPSEPQQGLLSPIKVGSKGKGTKHVRNGSTKSIKDPNASDSRLRGLFRGGRIAELVGSEVSKVGDMFWKKDNSNVSQVNSPVESRFPSEDSETDDEDVLALNTSPEETFSRVASRDPGRRDTVSPIHTKSSKPKYHMNNLPTFRSPFNREEDLPQSPKIASDHDHIARQQLAIRERGRSSRFDRLAPPKIDMRGISPSPSPSRAPSPDRAETIDESSRQSSSSRSNRRVRSAERKLNGVLGIPGKVGTGRPAPTGLSRLASHQSGSQKRPGLEDKRQWSIPDRGVSSARGTITKHDIARVRALLLSSGVKANEITRRAEEIPSEPSRFSRFLRDDPQDELPRIPRTQQYIFAGRKLVGRVENTNHELRNAVEEFSHSTIDSLHDQIKSIEDHVNYKLTPLVRSAADDADAFSTKLTTTHTLSVKQLNDSVDIILRKRRRRLRWMRRSGWAMLEWTLLGIMWMIWFIVMILQLVRGTIRGIFAGRSFADSKSVNPDTKPSIHDSDTIVLPGSQSKTAEKPQPPPPGPVLSASPTAHPTSPTPAKPSSDPVIPPHNVPLVPPTPEGGKVQTAPPTSLPPAGGANPIPPTTPPTNPSATSSSPPSPPPPSSPPPPKRKTSRFRRFLQTLFILTVLGYAGGTYYSLLSDNFHDFFTEYIPFGENAVLYFEEREFRKRFPNLTNPSNRPSADTGNKITIPSRSGVSWRVASDDSEGGSDLQTKGRHMSALDANEQGAQQAQQEPSSASGTEQVKAVDQAKKNAPPTPKDKSTDSKSTSMKSPPAPKETAPTASTSANKPAPSVSKLAAKLPEVNDPSIFMPLERIDPLKIKNADEPLVQDLVKIVNDIITVVNNDNASHKYSSTINKAKSELANVGNRILGLKSAEKQAAQEKIKATQVEFDNTAKELIRRLEEAMRDEQGKWREDFESEREKISQSYQERLKSETDRINQVSEQRQRNELLEQALAMKKQFLSEVTDQVETERNGRLSKLSDLSSSVGELEKLTADWNSVLDTNLKTQHLQVAVEAVRSSLESADRPRPFIKELAALKEVASDDSVVNSAIASINPTAYQRGIPTTAQLIDRFRRVSGEVRKASLLPEDAGVASHAASFVLSKFLFKKQGMTVGDDVESVLTRTESLLEEGNLDEAAREMNTLDGWAKTLSWDWLSECRRVLEVRQAMDVIATQARLEGLKVD